MPNVLLTTEMVITMTNTNDITMIDDNKTIMKDTPERVIDDNKIMMGTPERATDGTTEMVITKRT